MTVAHRGDRPGGRPLGRLQPVAASRAVHPVLAVDGSDVEVVARFPLAAYLAVGDALVAVVASGGVLLPNALALPVTAGERPLAGVRPGQRGEVRDGEIRVGPLRLRPARWWEPRPRLPAADLATTASAVSAVAARVAARRTPAPPALTAALRDAGTALARADGPAALAAAERLIGLGPGLTPSGDDALCGLVAGVQVLAEATAPPAVAGRLGGAARTLGEAVARLAGDRTTAISAALLRHAARAEVAAPAAGLLRAMVGHGDPAAATDALLAVGSTSGRDVTLGLVAAADLVVRAAPSGAVAGAPARTGVGTGATVAVAGTPAGTGVATGATGAVAGTAGGSGADSRAGEVVRRPDRTP